MVFRDKVIDELKKRIQILETAVFNDQNVPDNVENEGCSDDVPLLETLPQNVFILNSPFNRRQIHRIRLVNPSNNKLQFRIERKTNANELHFGTSLHEGLIEQDEALEIIVTFNAFSYGSTDTSSDSIHVIFTTLPDHVKVYTKEAFQKSGIIARKILPIVYNR